MDIYIRDYNGPAVEGPRIRLLTYWRVIERENVKFLVGVVVSEKNELITEFTRITQTSPIVEIKGRTVTTSSGSKYVLLEAQEGQPDSGNPAFIL